ncbi:MAG: alpha/beta hydrolase [Gammaproteobacteria bacterium]
MPTLNSNNTSIYYETVGQPHNPCIIFIMGIGGQLIHWPDALIQGIAARGFFVVTFDNRDVGLSGYYDHLPTPTINQALAAQQAGETIDLPYTLIDMADDVVTLMDGLAISTAHIVGISMGGFIAQYLALNHATRLLSVTLMATSSGDPGLPSPSDQVLDYFFKSKKDSVASTVGVLHEAIQRHVEQYQLYSYPDMDDLAAVIALQTKAYWRAYHPQGQQRQLLAVMFAKPRGKLLKAVNLPVLIIHGDHDPVVPVEHAYQLAACLPHAQLKIIEQMGHIVTQRTCPTVIDLIAAHCQHAN